MINYKYGSYPSYFFLGDNPKAINVNFDTLQVKANQFDLEKLH